jgi:hypothetical protein
MVTGEALRSAGWRLTAEHSSSSYDVPVIVAPDGQAIGDSDLVRVRFNGELMADPFGPEGRLLAGVTIRELLEETSGPCGMGAEAGQPLRGGRRATR